MTEAPLVSVVMPAWNASSWIGASIESVLAQTYLNWELIVVDDGSTDGTIDVARSYRDPRIHILVQENAGASRARNAGLRASSGQYIQYLDADDLLDPGKITAQVSRFDPERPLQLFSGRWRRFIATTDRYLECRDALCEDLAPRTFLQRALAGNHMMHPAAWLVPRPLAQMAGPWDERISVNDDGEYFARVIARSQGIRHVPGAVSWYRSNVPGSLSGRMGRSSAESQCLALASIASELDALGQHDASTQAIARARARLALTLWPSHKDLSEALAVAAGPIALRDVGMERPGSYRLLHRWLGWRIARRGEAIASSIRRSLGLQRLTSSWREALGD